MYHLIKSRHKENLLYVNDTTTFANHRNIDVPKVKGQVKGRAGKFPNKFCRCLMQKSFLSFSDLD